MVWSPAGPGGGLPGERVGRTAWIGAGREHAAVGIAPRDEGADAARADLRHRVSERGELGTRAFGNRRLDVELARLVHARVERVDERLRRKARRLHGLLWIHVEDEQVEHDLQIRLRLVVTAGTAHGHDRRAVLTDEIAHQRRARTLAGGEGVGMTG